jgi:lysozyme
MSSNGLKRIVIALAALTAGALLIVQVLYPMLEPAAFTYEVRGIDVSHHQGAIDWDRLKSRHVAFAYIKATEGETYNDPRFSRNWVGAEQAGILRGAYHFFTQCRPGSTQADNFIRVVPQDPNALPPVLDAEHMGPCGQGNPIKNIAAEIEFFLNRVEAQFKQRPIIYTTREFHDAYLAGKFPRERFWVRSIIWPPPRFRESQWVFWQYHHWGRRSGIQGPVDLNAFRGTFAELEALRKPTLRR